MALGWLWVMWTTSAASAPARTESVDVAIIPGCPTMPDGRLSECQWRRAVWGAYLYEQGLARHLIPSGGAAHTPYVEALSLASGMEALGVPPEAMFLETQALHTDQNTGYSLALADLLGFRTIGMASDPGHSDAMCGMADRWGRECTNFRMDYAVVSERMASLPSVVMEPIPRSRWIAEHREPRMATSERYRSIAHYTGVFLKSLLTGSRPPRPPGPEPTLNGSERGLTGGGRPPRGRRRR